MNKLREPSKAPRRRSRPKASHCQVALKCEESFAAPNLFNAARSTNNGLPGNERASVSTADPKGAIGSLNLDGAVALRCRHKSKRAACRLDSNGPGRFIRVVHELIEPDARFWSDS